MKIIAKPRGGGKTKELIEMSHELNYYIVCYSKNNCNVIMDMAKELGLTIPFPLTYSEFINKEYFSKGISGVLIDDIEDYLNYTHSVPVVGFSFTTKKSQLKKRNV